MITKCWQVISVIHLSISSRDTLDVDEALVSTTVFFSSAAAIVPFNIDATAVGRILDPMGN